MKHWTTKILAAGLALSLLTGQAALASYALGHDLHTGTEAISQGVSLTRSHFWSDSYGDLRTEHYITYTPGGAVQPVVAYGRNILSKETLTHMAKTLEEQGRRVVGGTNGDFYVVATGQPLGMVLTDGILRSSSSYHHAVGFREDGSAFIGRPDVKLAATLPSGRVNIGGGLNKIRELGRNGGGMVLMNSDFGANTQNRALGVDVILRPSGEKVGRSVPDEELWREPVPMPTPVPTPTPVPEATPSAQPETNPAPESAVTSAPEVQLPPEVDHTLSAESLPDPAGESVREPVPLTYSDVPRINSRISCTVELVAEETGARPIPEGCLILTMNSDDDPYFLDQLRALKPGDPVAIDIWSEDPRWGEAEEAVGALYRLLEDGEVQPDLDPQRAARTAVGIRADGSVLFYTIDGRQPGYSVGATFTQVAKRLLELGCVDAVGLDGGGSTTIGVTSPDRDSLGVVNKPSDGRERANSTALLLTTDLKPSGQPALLAVEPGDALLLAGSRLPLSATVVDSSYYAMGKANRVRWSAEGGGSVSTDGVYTAGPAAGTSIITGTGERGIQGSAAVTVVAEPDRLTVRNEASGARVTSLALDPGARVDLTASAQWRKLDLISQDESFRWSCDPQVGTVTPDGVFIAAERTVSGQLAVSAGNRTETIPVHVSGHILPLADMEGDVTGFTNTPTAQFRVESSLPRVRTGRQSLRVSYDTADGGMAELSAGLSFPKGERYLGLWIHGDGSANNLAAVFADASGKELLAPVAGLDFSGWEHRLAAIPEGAVTLTGFRFIYGGGALTGGTIWLDQLTTSTEKALDVQPPVITLELTGDRLTATVADDHDRSFPAGAVTLNWDGTPLTGTWNEKTSTLTAVLPLPKPPVQPEEGALPPPAEGEPLPESPVPAGLHRATVTAADVSGNLSRATVETGTPSSDVFDDMEGHWARSYAAYLYDQKVTTGVVEGENCRYYPDNNITRAEFFTMTARWLGLDLNAYADVVLPFDDADQIPEWALPALRAMYALGIVGGSQGEDGLYVNPNHSISRAEAMTILGRTQPRGWPEAELSGFTDGDKIPEWAAGYVRSLVGQQVVGGYEDGTLRPSATMTRGQVAKVLTVLR